LILSILGINKTNKSNHGSMMQVEWRNSSGLARDTLLDEIVEAGAGKSDALGALMTELWYRKLQRDAQFATKSSSLSFLSAPSVGNSPVSEAKSPQVEGNSPLGVGNSPASEMNLNLPLVEGTSPQSVGGAHTVRRLYPGAAKR
jgi:hypothetical protein